MAKFHECIEFDSDARYFTVRVPDGSAEISINTPPAGGTLSIAQCEELISALAAARKVAVYNEETVYYDEEARDFLNEHVQIIHVTIPTAAGARTL